MAVIGNILLADCKFDQRISHDDCSICCKHFCIVLANQIDCTVICHTEFDRFSQCIICRCYGFNHHIGSLWQHHSMCCHIRYPCGDNRDQGFSQTICSFVFGCVINGKRCTGQFRCTVNCLLRKTNRICRNGFIVHIQCSSLGSSGLNKRCLSISYSHTLLIDGTKCAIFINGKQNGLCKLITVRRRLLHKHIGNACNKLIIIFERLRGESGRSPRHNRFTGRFASLILHLIIRQCINGKISTRQHLIILAVCSDLTEFVLHGGKTIINQNLRFGCNVAGSIQQNTCKRIHGFRTIYTIINGILAVDTSCKRIAVLIALQNIIRTIVGRNIRFYKKVIKGNRRIILRDRLDRIADITVQLKHITYKGIHANIESLCPIFRCDTIHSDLLRYCDLAYPLLNDCTIQNGSFRLCILRRRRFICEGNRAVDIIGIVIIVIVLRVITVLDDVIIFYASTIHDWLVGIVYFKDIVINACGQTIKHD